MLRPLKMAPHHDPYDEKIRFGNCLYSASTASLEFKEIADFLKNNPSEIVIIDLNGWWEYTSPDYAPDFYPKLDSILDYRLLSNFCS